jgi:hypothetical protein
VIWLRQRSSLECFRLANDIGICDIAIDVRVELSERLACVNFVTM